jgi:hypothetical protein
VSHSSQTQYLLHCQADNSRIFGPLEQMVVAVVIIGLGKSLDQRFGRCSQRYSDES